jgi:hypothetical protein
MILRWKELVECYGQEVEAHKSKFLSSQMATYGLLCCRYDDICFDHSYHGVHAEPRLLDSRVWKSIIPAALKAWRPVDGADAILVVIVLNRSPCPSCSELLVGALAALNRSYPLACEESTFILACRGPMTRL